LQRNGLLRKEAFEGDLNYSPFVCFVMGVHEIATLSFSFFFSKKKEVAPAAMRGLM
jgi:hypothetical protein